MKREKYASVVDAAKRKERSKVGGPRTKGNMDLIPYEESVTMEPHYFRGQSDCVNLSKRQCKSKKPRCAWTENELGRGYCHGLPSSTQSLSQLFVPGIKRKRSKTRTRGKKSARTKEPPLEFSPSGRYNPSRIPEAIKRSWYPKASYTEGKFCRCLLEQHAGEMARSGRYGGYPKPQGICIDTISKSHARKFNVDENKLKDQIHAFYRKGGCSELADFDAMPPSTLYSYAEEHSKRGQGKIPFRNLPKPEAFFADMPRYKKELLREIKEYKNQETKTARGRKQEHLPRVTLTPFEFQDTQLQRKRSKR